MSNIKLRDVVNDYDARINIQNMMSDEKGLEMYRGKWDRTIAARYIYEIQKDNKVKGFVYLIDDYDGGYGKFLNLDIGIKNNERGKGIGKEVLDMIVNSDYKEFIIGETKMSNTAANNIIKKIGGVLVATNRNINIYLLQGKRLKEFIDQDGLEKINNRYSEPKILIKK